MAIEDRDLKAGTVLVARYKKAERTCEVVQTDDGLRYPLDDGTEHRSPSSAGKAAMGGVACNGWRFWSLQGTEPERRAEKPTRAKKEPAAKRPAAKTATKSGKSKSAMKPKAARAASKSADSYGRGVCHETFPTQKKAVAHAMTHTA